MTVIVRMLLAAVLTLAWESIGNAEERGTMICRGGIISIGDTVGDVLSKCGEPSYSSQRSDKRVEGGSRRSSDRTVTAINIDDWLYNFGPSQFQYEVIFENGRVARIESLGYGY